MTNDQAIKWLKDYRKTTDFTMPQYEEALDIAIKALQEQADRNEFYNWDAPIRHKADGEYILKSEAIRVASGYCHPSNIAKELEKLPSVAIPNKVGHWKPFDRTFGRSIYACSVCNTSADVPTSMGEVMYKYCPNCGAKMGGEEDG